MQNNYSKFLCNTRFNQNLAIDAVLDFYSFLNLSAPKNIFWAQNTAKFTESSLLASTFKPNQFSVEFLTEAEKTEILGFAKGSTKIKTDLIEQKIRLNIARKITEKQTETNAESIQNARVSSMFQQILYESLWKNTSINFPKWALTGDFGITFYDWLYQNSKNPLTKPILALMQSGIFSISVFDNLCIVCTWPKLLRLNNLGEPDDAFNPVFDWGNGFSLYAYKGFAMPADFYTENPSAKSLLKLTNVTQRMQAINLLGADKLSKMLKLELLADELDLSKNPCKLFGGFIPNDDKLMPIKLLQVTCPSTFRKFHLIVPNSINSAMEGVAWSFGKTLSNYKPDYET